MSTTEPTAWICDESHASPRAPRRLARTVEQAASAVVQPWLRVCSSCTAPAWSRRAFRRRPRAGRIAVIGFALATRLGSKGISA